MPLRPQAIIVLLEHVGCGEKLLKRSLVKLRLSLRAGSSLGHDRITRQPVGDPEAPIVMQSINQTGLPKPTLKFPLVG
jgi:hypothetical protein